MVLDEQDYLHDRASIRKAAAAAASSGDRRRASMPASCDALCARGRHEGDDERIFVSRKVYDQYCFDAEYGYHADDRTVCELMRGSIKRSCHCSMEVVRKAIFNTLPILYWLPRYEVKENLIFDIMAGLTVGIMHIPQGMAYASLAGLPPVFGLYTSFFPSLVYMFFGTSGHVSIGTFAVASLMTGSVRRRFVPPEIDLLYNSTTGGMINGTLQFHDGDKIHPIVVITALSFLVGVFQLIMGFLRVGFLVQYLSDQLVAGYTTGAALIILTTQVDKLFGVPTPEHEGPFKLIFIYKEIFQNLPTHTNVPTLIISLCCMTTIFLVKVFINERFKDRMRVPIPIDLIVIIIVDALSHSFDFENRFKVKVVKFVPRGIPAPRIPDFTQMPQLVPDALVMAIIVYSISVSMATLFARRHRYIVVPSQELNAYGIVNVVNSFLAAWPSGASVPRSCVQDSAGSKTQLCGGIGAMVVLVVLLWVGPVFQPLPLCVLASIIMVALKSMFMQLKELHPLWNTSKYDFFIFLVSFLATAIFDVTYGLLISVVFAAITVIIRTQRPPCLLMGKIPNTDIYMSVKRYDKIEEIPGVKIFRFDTALYFANADLFRSQMYRYIKINFQEMREQIKDEERKRKKFDSELAKANGIGLKQPLGVRIRNAAKGILPAGLRNRVFAADQPITANGASADRPRSPASDIFTLNHELTQKKRGHVTNHKSHATGNGNIVGGLDKSCAMVNPNLPNDDLEQPVPFVRHKTSRMISLALERNPNLPHHIIIDCSGFNYVDVMGVNMLKQVYRELKEISVGLLLANCKTPVRQIFEDCDFYNEVPKSSLYLSIQDAVMAAIKHSGSKDTLLTVL